MIGDGDRPPSLRAPYKSEPDDPEAAPLGSQHTGLGWPHARTAQAQLRLPTANPTFWVQALELRGGWLGHTAGKGGLR